MTKQEHLDKIKNIVENYNGKDTDLFLTALKIYVYRNLELTTDKLLEYFKLLTTIDSNKLDKESADQYEQCKLLIMQTIWKKENSFEIIFSNPMLSKEVELITMFVPQLLEQYKKDKMINNIKNIDMFLEQSLTYYIEHKAHKLIPVIIGIMYTRNKYTTDSTVADLIKKEDLNSQESVEMAINLIHIKMDEVALYMEPKDSSEAIEKANEISPLIENVLDKVNNFKATNNKEEAWLINTIDTLFFFKDRLAKVIEILNRKK